MTAAVLLGRLDRLGRFAEDAALVLILAAMIVLAGLQIGLRNFMDTSLVWADELLRIGVLWLGLLGAVAASRDDNHIRIDVLARLLPAKPRLAARVLVDVFTAGVCALVAYHATAFVYGAFSYDETLLGDLPAWAFQLILPLAFALIAYRYTVLGLRHTLALFENGPAA